MAGSTAASSTPASRRNAGSAAPSACRAESAGSVTTKTCATAYVAASATPIATAACPVSSSVLSTAAATTPPRCTNWVNAPVPAATSPNRAASGGRSTGTRGAARQSGAVAAAARASPAAPATATPAIAPSTPATPYSATTAAMSTAFCTGKRADQAPARPRPRSACRARVATTFRARASSTHAVSRAGNQPPAARTAPTRVSSTNGAIRLRARRSVNARARPRRCSGRAAGT